jgi:hypothetical protein
MAARIPKPTKKTPLEIALMSFSPLRAASQQDQTARAIV